MTFLFYLYRQGSHGRTTQYTCCYRSNNCLRDCYCDDDDKKRRKRIDLFCDHNDDVTLQCGKLIVSIMFSIAFSHTVKKIGQNFVNLTLTIVIVILLQPLLPSEHFIIHSLSDPSDLQYI